MAMPPVLGSKISPVCLAAHAVPHAAWGSIACGPGAADVAPRDRPAGFILASGYLLDGLAEYYLQTMYVPFEELEVIEREWRRLYNLKFKRSMHAPRAQLYEEEGDTLVPGEASGEGPSVPGTKAVRLDSEGDGA